MEWAADWGENVENSFRLEGRGKTPSSFINPLYWIIVDTNRRLWQVTKLEMKGMLIVLKFDWGKVAFVCVPVCAHLCVCVCVCFSAMLLGVGGAEVRQGQMPHTAEDHAWVTVCLGLSF